MSPSVETDREKKSTVPDANSSKTVLILRLQGFEPWTNRLRVYCSTNWAKSAYIIRFSVTQDLLYKTAIKNASFFFINFKIFLNRFFFWKRMCQGTYKKDHVYRPKFEHMIFFVYLLGWFFLILHKFADISLYKDK